MAWKRFKSGKIIHMPREAEIKLASGSKVSLGAPVLRIEKEYSV